MITRLDHVQIAIPEGAEDRLRLFYCDLLGLTEIPKPESLRARGGFWVNAGADEIHFGVDPDFTPALKAHPAFRVTLIEALATELERAGYTIRWDETLPEQTRFFTDDPVGNRVEFLTDETR